MREDMVDVDVCAAARSLLDRADDAASAAIKGQLGLRLPRVHQSGRAGHQSCQR